MSSLQDTIDRVLGKRPVAPAAVPSFTQRVAGVFKRRVPAIYDLSQYGKDLEIDLVDPRLTGATTFTYSAAATVHRTTAHNFSPTGAAATPYTPLLHSLDKTLTNLDTALLMHEGDDTAFNQDYLIEADMTAAVHQLQMSFAVALNVSNWVDGTLLLSSVSVTLASYMQSQSPLSQPVTKIFTPSSAFSALGANGTHLFIIRDFVDIPMKLRVNGPMTMNITINTSGSAGSDTFQVGLVDMYPIAKSTAAMRKFPSMIIAHIHPLPEHADELKKFTDFQIGDAE